MKNCSKRTLANSLMEWTLGSKTTFVEAENKILQEKVAKLGVELPNPDLACFETVYCEIDKFNRNGVRIPKSAAKKGIGTLLGKQINWNHEGAHQICGYIIDAEIKEDKIYITGILFKSSFRQEFDEVQKLFEDGKLFVSFEIWSRNEKGESIINFLDNGYRELTELVAHGCALLLIDTETGEPIPPACPVAQVQKLLASEKIIQEAEQIVNQVFEKNPNLVYAELVNTKEECNHCKVCTCQKEENNMDEIVIQEPIPIQKAEDEPKPLCPICQQPMNEHEELCAVCKKKKEDEQSKAQETPEPAQVVETHPEEIKAEAITDEPKVEEKSEVAQIEAISQPDAVIPEPAQVVEQPVEPVKLVKVITEETVSTVEIPNETGSSVERKGMRKCTRVYSDGKEAVSTEEFVVVDTYSFSQLEEKVAEAKAEKDTEIANLKKELDSKNQEIENLKVEKAQLDATKEQPDLTVGDANQKDIDIYLERRKKIDEIAYGKK